MSDVGVIYEANVATASIEGIASLEFDALLDENHEWSNDITANPVERGSPVADHIIENPDKFRLTAMVGESSLLGSADGAESLTQKAFDTLRELCKKGETVTVYTKYMTYEDMGISSVGVPRSNANGDSLTFSIEFAKIRIVSTQSVKVPAGISKKLDKKAGESTQKKTEPQKATGAKQPVATTEQSGSVLSSIFGVK